MTRAGHHGDLSTDTKATSDIQSSLEDENALVNLRNEALAAEESMGSTYPEAKVRLAEFEDKRSISFSGSGPQITGQDHKMQQYLTLYRVGLSLAALYSHL